MRRSTPSTAAAATAREPALPRRRRCRSRNLDFFYGKFHALKNINLDIAEQRVTAFIGPSGCGKSTLLRTLNRMYSLYPGPAREGEIMLQRPATSSTPAPTSTCCAPRSAWCSRSRRRSRCRSTTTSRSACACTRSLSQRDDGRARRMGAAQGGAVGRGEGQAEAERAWRCRAASSSACASRAASRSSPRCCCSTSRPRRSTRSRRRRSRS